MWIGMESSLCYLSEIQNRWSFGRRSDTCGPLQVDEINSNVTVRNGMCSLNFGWIVRNVL